MKISYHDTLLNIISSGMAYLTKIQKIIISGMAGTLAYGFVMVDLSIKALMSTASGFDTVKNTTHQTMCAANSTTKVAGWTLGLIAIAPTAGFSSRNIYKLLTEKRSNTSYAVILFLFLLFGIASGLLNSKNSYDASVDMFYDCNKPNKAEDCIWIILLSILSDLVPAIGNSIAFVDFTKEEITDIVMVGKQLTSSANDIESKTDIIRIKCRYLSLPILKTTTTLDSHSFNQNDLFYLAADKLCISGCLVFTLLYACKSYDEYSRSFSFNIMNSISIQPSVSRPISTVIGKTSWIFNSITTGLLFNRVLFRPIMPDVFSTSNGWKTILSILTLALIAAYPNCYIPLIENDIPVSRKIIDSSSMVVSSFIFAAFGLMETIEDRISHYYQRPYSSRENLTNTIIINTLSDDDENSEYYDIESLENAETLVANSNH